MAKKSKKSPKKEAVVIQMSNRRPLREKEIREEFRKYFVKLNRKLNIGKDMEQILWLHLKATVNNSPEMFDKGIKNFGYTL